MSDTNKRYSVIIGADIVPTESNYDLFSSTKLEELVGMGLIDLLRNANYRVFNLETPLTDEKHPIVKRGPALAAPCCTVNGIKSLGVDLFTLANNHIMDHGVEGLVSTCETLREKGIDYFGVGENNTSLQKYVIKDIGGVKYGFYACVEHEYSVATENSAGANPYEPLIISKDIHDLKEKSDFVIVLYHGGKEHYRYPSPSLQIRCREFIESGANIVVCQHSHCVGCCEKYKEGTIVYGQGNFIFDDGDNEFWNTGLLVCITQDRNIEFIPVEKVGRTVRLATEIVKKEVINGFFDRSEEIMSDDFVSNQYDEYAKENVCFYLRSLSGISRRNLLFHFLNRITHRKWEKIYIKLRFNKYSLLAVENIINCESHRELVLCGIREMLEKYE